MRLLIFLGILFCSAGAGAQEKIDTDRPDQTESSALVPQGWFQAEIGFQVDKDSNFRTSLHPSALWKFGISSWLELRMITELTTVKYVSPPENKGVSGLLPVQLGVKLKLFEEKGLRPQTALIMHTSFSKLASEKFQFEKWAPNFRFVLSNTLSKNISIGYNLGARWDGFINSPQWLYTFAPALLPGEKWKVYIESYGFVGKNHPPEHSLAGGLIYYVSDDVQLDVSPSFGLTTAAPDRYLTVGLSFRFK